MARALLIIALIIAAAGSPQAATSTSCQAPLYTGIQAIQGVEGGYLAAAGDFDHNGATDIAIVTFSEPDLALILNQTPAGHDRALFDPPRTLPNDPDWGTIQILTTDMNGDGWSDLVTSDYKRSVGDIAINVYLNQRLAAPSPPAFAAPVAIPTNEWNRPSVGDVNGDQRPDLMTGTTVIINTTPPGGQSFIFTQAVAPVAYADAMVLADLNGDGTADFASDDGTYVNAYLNTTPAGATVITAGPATSWINFSGSGRPSSLTAADVNADGRQDVVATRRGNAYYSGGVLVSMTEPTDTAASFNGLPVRLPEEAPLIADLNGDRRDELIVVQSNMLATMSIHADRPDAITLQYYHTHTREWGGIAADLNRDGRPDVIAFESPSQLRVLINQTDAGAEELNFGLEAGLAATDGAGGAWQQGLIVADLNRDQQPDLIASHDRARDAVIQVRMGQAAVGAHALTFGTPQLMTRPYFSVLPDALDLDGDGDLDLLEHDTLSENAGHALLINQTPLGASSATLDIAALPIDLIDPYLLAADLTGDQRPDLIGGTTDALVLLPNTTPAGTNVPSFGAPLTLISPAPPGAPLLADLDGDGRLDLAFPTAAGPLAIAMNTTTAGSAPTFGPASSPGVIGWPRAAGDFNSDGHVDLAVMEAHFNHRLSLLINTTEGGVSSPTFEVVPVAATSGGVAAMGDVDGDQQDELLTILDGQMAVLRNSAPPASPRVVITPIPIDPAIHTSQWYTLADLNRDGFPELVGHRWLDGNISSIRNQRVQALSVIGGDQQRAIAAEGFRQPLEVQVSDACGGPVAGARVRFSADTQGRVALDNAEVVTDAAGRAVVSAQAIAPGVAQVQAGVGTDGPAVTFALTVDPAADPHPYRWFLPLIAR